MFRSSVKYAANILSNLKQKEDQPLPSNQLLAYWITETQRGLDAFFNDDFEQATFLFEQHLEESPFHAVGYALMSYVDALLCFETEKIQIALKRITAADLLAKQFIKKTKRKGWYSAPADDACSQEFITCVSFDDSQSQAKKSRSVEIYYELIVLNCMLMSSTIQFLRNNWVEYLKAAYKLRKAYKLYEQMFESVIGVKTSEYATSLARKKTHPSITAIVTNSPQIKASWSDKRLSLFQTPHKKISLDSLITKKRPTSTIDSYTIDPTFKTLESTIESGVFFGIGLFSLVFSLLPPKVNKILNTLGFQSSRPFALHLLQRSFKTTGIYSSLSALSLVCYYTNLSMFIHPQLLPTSLSLENVRSILDDMKLAYPHGKMWKLLEGKLCKMEGKTRRGVEILRDARRRKTIRMEGSTAVLVKQSESAQLQALTVYEMGWGQIFLGDYFQAAETFFRLESMNNWSRAFYHYIATCCMFADEEYEKSALEYMQIPNMLNKKRQAGGRLLPNEVFVDRKIRYWKTKADGAALTGSVLKRVVVVNPLWELIYLWNGVSQLTVDTLQYMKQSIETTLATVQNVGTDLPQLYLLLGVCVRELGDLDLAEVYLLKSLKYEDDPLEDQWVIPHGLYEMAALSCFRLIKCKDKKRLYYEAHDWIKKAERCLIYGAQQQQDSLYPDNSGDADWDSRLHVRCQLLKEKLEDFK